MFDRIAGLAPEQAERWTAVVEQCRPVLAVEGMEAVQALLVEHGMSVIQAIVITRALLGWDETPLRVATDIVATSAARATATTPPVSSSSRHAQAAPGDKTNRAPNV